MLVVMFTHMATKFIFYVVVKSELLFDYTASSFSIGYGPLLFLYVKSKVSKTTIGKREQLLHLLPFLVLTVTYLVVVISASITYESKLLWIYQDVMVAALLPSHVSYFGFILFCIFKKPQKYKDVTWLKWPLSYMFLAVVVAFAAAFTVGTDDYLPFRIFAYLGIFYIALAILRNYILINRESEEQKTNRAKYEKSGLKKELALEIVEELQGLMKNDKLYLNADLKLDQLSNRMSYPKHHITEALNSELNKNFYQFVNEFRVNEAKEQLENGFDQNLIQLAFSSGFNSKTTFNTYFKKYTGKTPNEYRSALSSNYFAQPVKPS